MGMRSTAICAQFKEAGAQNTGRENEPGVGEALRQKAEGHRIWQDVVSSSEFEPAQNCVAVAGSCDLGH